MGSLASVPPGLGRKVAVGKAILQDAKRSQLRPQVAVVNPNLGLGAPRQISGLTAAEEGSVGAHKRRVKESAKAAYSNAAVCALKDARNLRVCSYVSRLGHKFYLLRLVTLLPISPLTQFQLAYSHMLYVQSRPFLQCGMTVPFFSRLNRHVLLSVEHIAQRFCLA